MGGTGAIWYRPFRYPYVTRAGECDLYTDEYAEEVVGIRGRAVRSGVVRLRPGVGTLAQFTVDFPGHIRLCVDSNHTANTRDHHFA